MSLLFLSRYRQQVDLFDLGTEFIKSVGMPLTVATLRRIDCDIKSNQAYLGAVGYALSRL